MTPDLEAFRAGGGGRARDHWNRGLPAGPVGDREALEELYAIWRGARDEATIAYRRWSRRGTRDAYAVYRAASDREDAAQAMLAARLEQ